MKRFAPASIAAMTLAAAFALAAPGFGQETAERAPQPTAQQQYETLQDRLAQAAAQRETRKNAIIEELQAQNPALSAEQLETRATAQLDAELERESQDRWNALQNERQGAPNIDLPSTFYKAVRGCTTDGYIYRVTYNLTVNFDQLATPSTPDTPLHERSLLQRLVQPNPDSVLGVSGTDRFVEELKTMTADIHNSMQVITGRLIDEAPAQFLEQPIFTDILELATAEISVDVREKLGVDVNIRTDAPQQQAGRCEPAAPPERLPQEQPAIPQLPQP